MRSIIFIGGIHGVGKTFFCNEISTKYNLLHFSASDLISKGKDEKFPKNKKIANIDQNQDILISSIKTLTPINTPFLLDGHFCLLDLSGRITRVPVATFSNLALKGILVLTDSVEQIQHRLHKRDSSVHDIKLLKAFQKEELNYSREISEVLNIPYLVYKKNENSNSYNEFLNFLLKVN